MGFFVSMVAKTGADSEATIVLANFKSVDSDQELSPFFVLAGLADG